MRIPTVGQIYRHYKGDFYVIKGIVVDADQDGCNFVVIYDAVNAEKTAAQKYPSHSPVGYCRSLSSFFSCVEGPSGLVERFALHKQ